MKEHMQSKHEGVMLNVCGLLDIKVAFASSVGMHERVKHGGLRCDGCGFTYK